MQAFEFAKTLNQARCYKDNSLLEIECIVFLCAAGL